MTRVLYASTYGVGYVSQSFSSDQFSPFSIMYNILTENFLSRDTSVACSCSLCSVVCIIGNDAYDVVLSTAKY